jgi:hypothetical protein
LLQEFDGLKHSENLKPAFEEPSNHEENPKQDDAPKFQSIWQKYSNKEALSSQPAASNQLHPLKDSPPPNKRLKKDNDEDFTISQDDLDFIDSLS